VDTFIADAENEANAVLDAVLWDGGLLPMSSGSWPDKMIDSGLAIIPSGAVAIDLAAEPLLHAELTNRLRDASVLRDVKGYGKWLRVVANSDKGLAWEKVFALHALSAASTRVQLPKVLGVSPPGFIFPPLLSNATVLLTRTASAWDNIFSCLFDDGGNPLPEVLAVKFNQFAGPDIAFFARLENGAQVLVLVQCRNVAEGTVADAVQSVTLGNIGARSATRDSASRERTKVTKRVRANVADLRKSEAPEARWAFDNAVRVVAHPFGFQHDAVEHINTFNNDHPGEAVLLAQLDADAVHSSILQHSRTEPPPQLRLGSVSDSSLRRISLEGIADDVEPSEGSRDDATVDEAVALEKILARCVMHTLVKIGDKVGVPTRKRLKAELVSLIVAHLPRALYPGVKDIDIINQLVRDAGSI
jgi:hypothetical protein